MFSYGSLISIFLTVQGYSNPILKYWREGQFHKWPRDERNYSRFILQNGLDAFVVRTNTTECAASMSIPIGYEQDPIDRPGMAHFLEHMLFLATEKYPIESEYKVRLHSCGGRSNAFTSYRETNYFFSVNCECFEEILDRFAQFFISPLFTKDSIERELYAIDSEHSKNIPRQSRRGHEVFKSIRDPSIPFTKFSTGNHTTLTNNVSYADLRQMVLDFHERFYSAHEMTLVLWTNTSSTRIKEVINEQYHQIKRHNVERAPRTFANFNEYAFDTLVEVPSFDETSQYIDITFTTPHTWDRYKHRIDPNYVISGVLGDEGPFSLYQYLYSNGLITALSTSRSSNHQTISMRISLTDSGSDNYLDVLTAVFDYIEMMKTKTNDFGYFEEEKIADLERTLSFDRSSNNPITFVYSVASLIGQLKDQAWFDEFFLRPQELIHGISYVVNETISSEIFDEIIENLRPEKTSVIVYYPNATYDKYEPVYGQKYKLFDRKLSQLLKGHTQSASLSEPVLTYRIQILTYQKILQSKPIFQVDRFTINFLTPIVCLLQVVIPSQICFKMKFGEFQQDPFMMNRKQKYPWN